VICFVVLALVFVLSGVLDLGVLGVLGVLLLVGLLLDCTSIMASTPFLHNSWFCARSLSFTRSVPVDSSVTVKRFSRVVVDRLCRSSCSSRGIVVRTLSRLLVFRAGSTFVIILLKYCFITLFAGASSCKRKWCPIAVHLCSIMSTDIGPDFVLSYTSLLPLCSNLTT